MRLVTVLRLVSILAASFAAPALGWAQPSQTGSAPAFEPVAPAVVTDHVGVFNGQAVAYSATVGETVLRDTKGLPAATIFSVAYVRTGAVDRSRRPVIFLFNGGPGSSSSQLHLDAFGPVHPSKSRDAGADAAAPDGLAVNPYSLLSDADLVFIDPVGTGFSRVLPGGAGKPYWSAEGDARSVLGFIRDWLRDNRRADSPTFICGESYGGTRLALILRDAKDLKLDGAIFLSPALDWTAANEAPGNDLPYILSLPTMTTIAWYHSRIPRNGNTAEAAFEESARFAQTEYAPALLQGDRLPEAARTRVAGEVAARVGLPVSQVLKDNLRIPIQDFVTGLLSDSGKRVGRTDGRYVGVAADFARKSPPYDDPAISFGGSEADLITGYLVNDLKFATQRRYTPLAMNVNMGWTYEIAGVPRTYVTVAPFIGVAMRANPRLKLFVGGGYYDLATPLLSVTYALDHANLPPGRLTEAHYESGHSMYQNAASLAKLSADVRAFIHAAVQ